MIKTPIKTTEDYNKIVGERLRFFRELHNITQTEIAQKLGYTSTGTWSLIENGIRGLNKTKMAEAAKILGTYVEVLTSETEMTKDELIDMNTLMDIRTNPKHPRYKELLKFLKLAKEK